MHCLATSESDVAISKLGLSLNPIRPPSRSSTTQDPAQMFWLRFLSVGMLSDTVMKCLTSLVMPSSLMRSDCSALHQHHWRGCKMLTISLIQWHLFQEPKLLIRIPSAPTPTMALRWVMLVNHGLEVTMEQPQQTFILVNCP